MQFARLGRRAVATLGVTAIGLATTASPSLAIQVDHKSADTEQLSAASVGETTVLGIDLGQVLQLRLLGEDGLAGLDDAGNVDEALSRLVPLEVVSATLPALNAATLPTVEAHSTGGEDRKQTQAVSVSDTLPAAAAGLLGGSIDPATLLALVNDSGAQGLLSGSVTDLSALAGLLGIDEITAQLGGTASADDATGDRSVTVGQLEALDLTGLLQLVGLDLLDLPLDQLTGLTGALGLIDDLASDLELPIGDLNSLIGDLGDLGNPLAARSAVESALATAQAAVDPNVAELCQSLVGGLPLPLPVACTDLTLLTDLVDQLQTQLNEILALIDQLPDLVDGLLGVLDGAPLLGFGGLDAGVIAAAARTVEDSVAAVEATVGDVFVAGQVLPGLDVGATVAQVNALAGQVTAALDDVLAVVGLDGILDIGVLETNTKVAEADGVITALAELTGLRITLTPPDVCALLGDIDPTGTVGGLLGGLDLDVPLPALDLPVGDLLGGLGSVVSCSGVQTMASAQVGDLVNALTQPLTIQAATISEISTLSVETASAPAPTPGAPATPAAPADPSLPLTGGTTPLLVVTVLAAAALGIRYGLRRQT